jgi:site-specific DNA-methyltransferase (cytosine-N4-specific)
MMKKLEIENQTIYFKSSESMDDIKSNSVTLVVTSPPYWNAKDYGYDEQIGFGQSYVQYIDSLNKVWKECIRVLQPNGKIAINVQPLPISAKQSGYNRRVIQNIMFDIEKFMRENDMHLSGMIYWNKAVHVNNVSWGSYPKPTNIASNTSFEQIFVWVKRGDTRKIDKDVMEQNLLKKQEWRHWAVRCIWDDISPVIKINSKGENVFGHSAPFPEDIPYRLIRMHTVEGETVVDPFLGSGTTLKVCRLLNRKGIGFELNQEYKELIQTRIMEDWKPPKIEGQYTTIGSETFKDLINKMIRISRQNKTFIIDKPEEEQEDIIKKQKLLTKRNIQLYFKKENIFNDAFIEKIGFKNKKKKEQTTTIDNYFENGKN